MRFINFFFFLILMAFNKGCSGEATNMIFMDSNFKDMSCKVYFFKSWATYQHPVTPVGALEYEDALKLTGYYRAWMCDKNSENYFMYFEGIENKIEKTDIKNPDKNSVPLKFYLYNEQNGAVGSEISGSDTFNVDKFYFSSPNNDYLQLITHNKGISYEYIYDQSGVLKEALITDFDKNIKTLSF